MCRRLQQYMLLSRTTSSVFFAVDSVRAFFRVDAGWSTCLPRYGISCRILLVAPHFCCLIYCFCFGLMLFFVVVEVLFCFWCRAVSSVIFFILSYLFCKYERRRRVDVTVSVGVVIGVSVNVRVSIWLWCLALPFSTSVCVQR